MVFKQQDAQRRWAAAIFVNRKKEWYINGKLHRTDGPAIIYSTGYQEWWINDIDITEEVKNWMKTQNINWPWDNEIQAQFLLTFCC